MCKPDLKLSGEDSHASVIIARARRVARRAGWTAGLIEQFTEEAKSGDYAHLLDTCEKYFDVY